MEKKKSWVDCTEPDEIMELLKHDGRYTKAGVLAYFGKIGDLETLSNLLNSKHFTPEEVAAIPRSSFVGVKYQPARDIIINYANQSWESLTNVADILNMRVCILPLEEEMEQKIDYLNKINPNFVDELTENSYSNERITPYKIFTVLCMEKEKYKDKIVHLLLNYPSLSKYLCGQNIDREIWLEYEKAVIQARKVKGSWKKENSYELIMYQATEQNKWEILEYFAKRSPQIFNSIIKNYTNIKMISKIGYTIYEVVEHYKDIDLSTLPQPLVEYIEKCKADINSIDDKKEVRKQLNAERRQESLKSWYNEDGSVVELFKMGNIVPYSREDYLAILTRFMSSDLNVATFCSKYKISNINGFRKMLEKFSLESDIYAEQINKKLESASNKFMGKTRKLIEDVCVNNQPLSILFGNSKSHSLSTFINFAKKTYQDSNMAEILVNKVIEYYYTRTNEYGNSFEPENIAKMLTLNEVRFLVGEEILNQMVTGAKVGLSQIFMQDIRGIVKPNADVVQTKVNGRGDDKLRSKLTQYNSRFKKNEYFRSTTTLILGNGEQVQITPEMVDMAYQFVKSHKLYPAEKTMQLTIRAVANGKIQNQEQTQDEKKTMREQAMALINEITSIDEYFKAVNGLSKK